MASDGYHSHYPGEKTVMETWKGHVWASFSLIVCFAMKPLKLGGWWVMAQRSHFHMYLTPSQHCCSGRAYQVALAGPKWVNLLPSGCDNGRTKAAPWYQWLRLPQLDCAAAEGSCWSPSRLYGRPSLGNKAEGLVKTFDPGVRSILPPLAISSVYRMKATWLLPQRSIGWQLSTCRLWLLWG